MPIIARTIDVERRIGDGRLIGYAVPSCSMTVFEGLGGVISDVVTTAESSFSSSLGLEKNMVLGLNLELLCWMNPC